ncbi:MAG: hypothetical protein JJ958_06735 [Balneola sp.]|nr:hypothetical protein [Balneola sp.]
MITETKTFIEEALVAAGFKSGKITTTEESKFDADNDIRPVSAFYGVKIENLTAIDHAGNVKQPVLKVLIIIADYDQENAVKKILNIDDELNGKYVEYADARFTMEDEWRLVGDPVPLVINKKECSYAIEYQAKVTIRRT